MAELSHTDSDGKARQVDVSAKEVTRREASAEATVQLNAEAFAQLAENRAAKGDVLTVAKLAGIGAAKKTADLIPLCHLLHLDSVDIEFELNESEHRVRIVATVRCQGRTGVEMEAMTAVSVAALTIYDMLKAVQRDITISEVRLLVKSGGRSGSWQR